MLTKVRYSPKDMFLWTRWETLLFFLFAIAITLLYKVAGFTFLHLPWAPIAVIGTAVAFIIGFQNNAAYGRIWEARKIWGGIVNTSRSWGMKVSDMVSNEYAAESVPAAELQHYKRTLIYRHIAWLTALRHAMRQPKKWETSMKHRTNKEWLSQLYIPERISSLHDDLIMYLSDEELEYVMQKSNKAVAILYLQSRQLRRLKERGLIWEFSFLELENMLEEMFSLQGKSERIKNFPYPRQYATLSYYFVLIFIFLLPFASVPEFAKIGAQMADNFPLIAPHFVWVSVPFYVLVAWVFHTMERIGRVGENPFESTPNDVPISTISRGIEIDLCQMLDQESETILKQFPEQYDVQM